MAKLTADVTILESLATLLGMVHEGIFTSSDQEMLDEMIGMILIDDGYLNEGHMTPKQLMAARRNRIKNHSKLEMIAKKKKLCMDRLKASGRDIYGLACGSNGMPHRVNKARSKAARKGSIGRRI